MTVRQTPLETTGGFSLYSGNFSGTGALPVFFFAHERRPCFDHHGPCRLFAAPENWCRAIFLQLAIRVKRRRAGLEGRELSRFFAEQAEAAYDGAAGFPLYAAHPLGADFGQALKRQLLVDAAREVVESIKASAVAPENWNACPRWRDWGIVKAREWVAFLEAEYEALSNANQ